MRIRAVKHDGTSASLLDPSAPAWEWAEPRKILLSRTPRLYQTEPPFSGTPPVCTLRALRAGDRLVLRLEWTDATKSETASFPDAAAVMMPQSWSGGASPSLVMGDPSHPVRIFYWNALRGAEEMTAQGRATPAPVGRRFEHRAVHRDGRWLLTMDLALPPDGSPLALALWDGATNDRDGLKFFSIWYWLALETTK
jgi:DMSO reductase family type II enzyme heme b subunit